MLIVPGLFDVHTDTCSSSCMFDIPTNFMQSVHLSTCSTFHSVWSSIHSINHKQIYTDFFVSTGPKWSRPIRGVWPWITLYKMAFMTLVLELWQTKGMSKPFVFICITFPTGVEQIPAPLPVTSLLIYMWSVFMNDDRCGL